MSWLNAVELFLQTAVQMGTPLLFGTLGGILSEKVGHLNLGVEGMMLMGAVMGFQVGVLTGNPALAVLAAGLAGMIGALIYAVITITFMGNQVVTGLALTIFGTGFSSFIGAGLSGVSLPENVQASLAAVNIPLLSKIPFFGPIFFQQSLYSLSALVLAVLLYVYLNKTRYGLNMRMVGENPSAAEASGINATLYKYVHILAGGFCCGLGGAFLTLVFVPRWQDNITAGQGWIAVALVIFATWNPLKAIFGAYFFGMLRGLGFRLQSGIPIFGHNVVIPAQILDMLPYIMTIAVLVFITMNKKKENQAPAWLGSPYLREER